MEQLNTILETIIPIIIGLSLAGIQRWYMYYKTKKFKFVDHPLFSDLLISINEIKSWYVQKNRDVFRQALIIKLKCWHIRGLELAKELQNGKYSNLQLQNKVLTWATNTVNDYANKWKEDGIPNKVIERITITHQIKVDKFIEEIKAICFNNDMYLFKTQKVIAIFDTLRVLLMVTINDFNKLLYRDKYNGDFIGISYKNIPINDKEYEEYSKK